MQSGQVCGLRLRVYSCEDMKCKVSEKVVGKKGGHALLKGGFW